jgi:membrane associated rhomboid family serine protease
VEFASVAAIVLILVGLVLGTLRKFYYHQTIVVIVLAVFALQYLTAAFRGFVLTSPIVFELGFISAVPPPLSGVYTIFTSMFVHANFLHVLFNMIALLFIGSLLERRMTSPRFLLLYLVTGVLATLVFLLANYDKVALLVGASGAISGILGALARLYPYDRLMMFFGFIPIPSPAWMVVVIFLVIQVFISFTSATIAWEAHLGGALAGYFLAPLIMRIPVEGAVRERPTVDAEALRELAVTPRAQEILSHLEGETHAEVQQAWLERFADQVQCPECLGPLRLRRRELVSDCGWSRRF